tara:strand:+ start:7927 stop:9384 length:1458 start_codon:yes stop_codon:yes gene_type:complete
VVFKVKNQIIVVLVFCLVILFSRGSNAGFLDDLKESLEESVGEIEKTLDQGTIDSNSTQGQAPEVGTKSSAKSAEEIASGNAVINFFCPLDPDAEPKSLPNGLTGLVGDFGKSTEEQLSEAFANNNPPKLPYILNLKQYNNAFDDPEIQELFSKFTNSGELEHLAWIREITLKKDHRLTWVKKADALFAYGLVHIYYQNVGGNAEKGFKYIKKAAKPIHGTKHKQYGASYIAGTRRYNGYGEDINLSAATTYMNVAYEIARNRSDSFAKTVQTEFLRLISEPANPARNLYAELGKQAEAMRQSIMQEFSNSARSANPEILKKSQKLAVMRNDLLIEMGTIAGMGKDLEEFKVSAQQQKSEADPTNLVVQATIVLGDGFAEKLKNRMGSIDKLDENGLKKLESVHQDNENLLYTTGELTAEWFSYQAVNMANGGGGLNLFETVEVLRSLDGMTNRMCSVRAAIMEFGKRTDVTINSSKELKVDEGI